MNKKQKKSIEILEAIGQENEKDGIKWTKHFMDKFNKREWEKNQFIQENMKKNRVTKKKYYEMCAGILNEFIKEMDKPSNKWQVIAYYTVKGVVVQVKTIGRVFQRAFTPCGTPKVDFQAILTFLASAEDTMYKIENDGQLDVKTKNGVFLK